jgi:hypothetical protein
MEDLERQLKSLHPASTHVDPIAAAYAAGRRSARRQTRIWQCTAAAAVIICGFLAVPPQHLSKPSELSITMAAMPPLSDQSVFVLQQMALEHGVDNLPRIPPAEGRILTVRDSL